DDAGGGERLGELAVAAGVHGLAVGGGEELGELAGGVLGAAGAERAVGAADAVGGEGIEGGGEAGGLVAVELLGVERGVHRPVQDQAAGAGGEEPGVGGAEEGAVREADVVQLV